MVLDIRTLYAAVRHLQFIQQLEQVPTPRAIRGLGMIFGLQKYADVEYDVLDYLKDNTVQGGK